MTSMQELQTTAAHSAEDAAGDNTGGQAALPSRRDVIKAGLATGAALVAAPALRTGSSAAAGFQGTITMYGQTYNPTRSMVVSTSNPVPRNHLQLLADRWEKLHPGVHIVFTNGPGGGDYYSWIRAQLTGGVGPDIFWWQTDTRFVDTGRVVQLDKYLQEPNPYNPKGGKWGDTFQNPYYISAKSANNHYGWVPTDLVSTAVFYNKDIFSKAGVLDAVPPKTWEDYMKISEALYQHSGGSYQIFGSNYVPRDWWAWGTIGDELMQADVKKFDVLNYHPGVGQVGIISEEEMVRAVNKGLWLPSKDPALRSVYNVFKRWSKYFMRGWAAGNHGDPTTAFLQGRLAMLWDGSWNVAIIRNDPRRTFGFSTFWIPPITKTTSPFAQDPPIQPKGVGGYGSLNYAVNGAAVKRGSAALCVDFLQFLTNPSNDAFLVNEQPQFVPAVKGAPQRPEVAALLTPLKNLIDGNMSFTLPFILGGYQGRWYNALISTSTEYFQGQISLDDAMAQLDTVAKQAAKEEQGANEKGKTAIGTWDTSKW